MAECITCGGELVPMGSLGKKQWYRCRNCGMDQSREVENPKRVMVSEELPLSPKIQAFEDWLDKLSEKYGVSTNIVAHILLDEDVKSVDDVTFNEADSLVKAYLT